MSHTRTDYGPTARIMMRSFVMHSWKCQVIIRFIFIILIFSYVIPEVNAQEVVVNLNVSEIELTRSSLRSIFGMRLRTWPDGSLIRVFVLSDHSPLHVQFSKKILNIFPYQLRRTWDRLVYSGTGQAPTEMGSIQEMGDKVASTPGAIGYLPDGNTDFRVRVVEKIGVKR